jgi:hypothetical protein
VVAESRRPAASLASVAKLLGVTVLAASATLSAPAAASPTDAELKAARDLFADAVKDEDAGRWSDALDKLHHVADVKLTSGVRYHLALCDEHLGHMVAALDAFTAVQAQATTDGAHDVLRLVGKHLVDLGPRVPRLTVRVLPTDVTATVRLDGVVLPASSVGTPLPVDPGVHKLEASAESKAPAVATVTLQERDVTSIDLKLGDPVPVPVATPPPPPAWPPASPPAPAAPPPGAASPAQTSPPGGTRTGAIIATAGAAVLAGGGVLAFVLAGNAVTSGEQQCAAQRGPCDTEKNTVRAWDFTAAGAWIGAAAAGTFAVLLWMQPPGSGPETVSARLVFGPASAGVWGRF